MSAPITITGNLVADPELKFTQNTKALATFTVVSSKSSKKPDGTGKTRIRLRHGLSGKTAGYPPIHFVREFP
jgi:hypothetical protein